MTTPPAARQMTLVAFLQAQNCSNYSASWRHAATTPDFLTAEYYQRIARTLEDGKFHMAFFDDRLAMPDRPESLIGSGARCLDTDADHSRSGGSCSRMYCCADARLPHTPQTPWDPLGQGPMAVPPALALTCSPCAGLSDRDRALQGGDEMMEGWGMQGWGMGGGFGWGSGFGGMLFMGLVSALVIVGIVLVARWALEQGGSARKPPAG